MYVGYQNNKACFIGQSEEELENLPCVIFDKIEEINFAQMYNGVIYTTEQDLQNAKRTYVRQIRDDYLVKYIDTVVSNPLRWSDMSEEEQSVYQNYRRYLLDYTQTENWFENLPLTFDEWKMK